jgi:hypothetical protein
MESHDATKTLKKNLLLLLDSRVKDLTKKKLNPPITAMLKTFAPNVDKPPSAKISACIIKTIVMPSIAMYGPRSTARKVPPTRCPLVPYKIGKFIIWAAKIKALETASMGVTELEYVCFAFFHDRTRNPTDSVYINTQIVRLRNPSGMCI